MKTLTQKLTLLALLLSLTPLAAADKRERLVDYSDSEEEAEVEEAAAAKKHHRAISPDDAGSEEAASSVASSNHSATASSLHATLNLEAIDHFPIAAPTPLAKPIKIAPPKSLDSMPATCSQHIASFLPAHDMYNFSRINRRHVATPFWRDITLNTPAGVSEEANKLIADYITYTGLVKPNADGIYDITPKIAVEMLNKACAAKKPRAINLLTKFINNFGLTVNDPRLPYYFYAGAAMPAEAKLSCAYRCYIIGSRKNINEPLCLLAGETLLTYTIKLSSPFHFPFIEHLLNSHASADAPNSLGETPRQLVSRGPWAKGLSIEIIDQIKSQPCSISTSINEKMHASVDAARDYKMFLTGAPIASQLTLPFGTDIDKHTQIILQTAWYADKNGHIDSLDGETLLTVACKNNAYDLVLFLLDYVDATLPNRHGETPLSLAQTPAIKKLIEQRVKSSCVVM